MDSKRFGEGTYQLESSSLKSSGRWATAKAEEKIAPKFGIKRPSSHARHWWKSLIFVRDFFRVFFLRSRANEWFLPFRLDKVSKRGPRIHSARLCSPTVSVWTRMSIARTPSSSAAPHILPSSTHGLRRSKLSTIRHSELGRIVQWPDVHPINA